MGVCLFIGRQPVTERALLARLHGVTNWKSFRRTSEPATCFMQRKLPPKSKSVAYAEKYSIPNATQSLKPTKKSCFCIAIRLKMSQNTKKLQLFPSYQGKSVALDAQTNPPASQTTLPSYSRDFISFWYPAYKHAGIWHACMPIPLRVYQRERRRNTKKI